MSDTLTILSGDCRQKLKELPDQSVQCCVTSPPYWGLRDYGCDGQIGLEKTPQEYVETMRSVFEEVWRVLRDDGTLWLNLGDSYARAGGYSNNNGLDGVSREDCTKARTNAPNGTASQKLAQGLKSKDLCGIPWRVAFALQADGWYLRQDIIWAKPNPMPESVTDRCTKAHEYIFLLTKSERYFYDSDAVKEQAERCGDIPGGGALYREQIDTRMQVNRNSHKPVSELRNKRDVWTVATNPYSEAHFATFPPDLIKPCILAGTKPGDTVLDPFGGSGTTGMVALEFGRKAILIELNPDYVELAKDRTNVTPGLPLLTIPAVHSPAGHRNLTDGAVGVVAEL